MSEVLTLSTRAADPSIRHTRTAADGSQSTRVIGRRGRLAPMVGRGLLAPIAERCGRLAPIVGRCGWFGLVIGGLVVGLATGCGQPTRARSAGPIAAPTSAPPRASVSAGATSRRPAPTSSATSSPTFSATVAGLQPAEVAHSWRPGCPVGPARLRAIRLGFWGFDGAAHTGTIVVNAAVVPDVITVFGELYRQRFPIRSIRPVEEFAGSDPASMAADNTSGFNCRNAVAPGPSHWSVHAYGEAIDVNPVENPYLEAGTVMPSAGTAYLDRSRYRPGLAVPDGVLVRAFAAVGWQWGGRWSSAPDYQHFSRTGG